MEGIRGIIAGSLNMFEILFIFGAFAWLLGAACEFLSSLAAFPTILTALVLVPLLACADYLDTLHRLELGGMHQRREPVPPERFYWELRKTRLLRSALWIAPAAVVAWAGAIWWPAAASLDVGSVVGWVAGATAVLTSARVCSRCAVYVHASRWFDKMAPWAVGICRRTLYRISDNPDFLAPDNPERRAREKSVY